MPHPFRSLPSKLPRFSHLVRRREFIAAIDRLRDTGRLEVQDRDVSRDSNNALQRILEPAAFEPWRISVGTDGRITVSPSWLRLAGSAQCIFPDVGGRSILDGGYITGKGTVCIEVKLAQVPRLMTWTYRISGTDELRSSAQIHLHGYNTTTVTGTPRIIVTNDTGTLATLNTSAGTATAGTYLIPIGYVGNGLAQTWLHHPLQISLRGAFLEVIQLGTL